MDEAYMTAIRSDDFSPLAYRKTLEKGIQLGYAFPTVSELGANFGKFQRFLLLRHDIDTSPRYALQMALLEHDLQVRSSFYVLLHTPFYNPAAPGHWDDLRKITDLGFEVGLHYQTDFFEQRNIDPLEGILGDVVALEKILGIKVSSVSQHRPASCTFLTRLGEFYIDAYSEKMMRDAYYISDSGFKWRGSTLFDLLGKEERIHALIHPLTWSFAHLDMTGTYRRVCEEIASGIRGAFEECIMSTNLYLATRDQLDVARKAQYSRNEARPVT